MKMKSSYTQTSCLPSSSEISESIASNGSLKIDAPSDQERMEAATLGINTLWKQFPYEQHTFQYINPKSGKSPVRVYTDKKDALKEAIVYNEKGSNVFFMVNEGDGEVHEDKVCARAQASVIQLSQCFIDT